MPHLVAVHLIAMFKAKRFAEGNVDGVAHDGHSEGIAYHL